MNKEVFSWKKVSFSECLNKYGRIIKTIGFTLVGIVSFKAYKSPMRSHFFQKSLLPPLKIKGAFFGLFCEYQLL